MAWEFRQGGFHRGVGVVARDSTGSIVSYRLLLDPHPFSCLPYRSIELYTVVEEMKLASPMALIKKLMISKKFS